MSVQVAGGNMTCETIMTARIAWQRGGNVFTANYIIDEFRIDKTALWTEAFTPPAEPYR